MSRPAGPEREPLRVRWKRWWRDHVERATPVLRIKRWLRQRQGTEPVSRVELRCRRRRHGGWVIREGSVRPGDLLYSFGVGRDLRFERDMATEYGARVYAFDPTPTTRDWVRTQSLPEGLRHVPVAVGDRDETAELFEPRSDTASHSLFRRRGQTGRSFEVPVRTLSTILRELGHRRIDHLKLDIEGAEYAVLRDLVQSRLSVRQVLVEFHHRFRAFSAQHTREALAGLREAGFRIFYVSPDGREYSFLRPDADAP